MPAPGQTWPFAFKVVSCVFHTIAIASGVFRTAYRWYISRFGWEDTWAALAVVTDVGCLVCLWLQRSTPLHPSHSDMVLNFVATATLTSVPWESRLSMIATVIRITNPRQRIRNTSFMVAISFGVMWAAMLAMKLYICGTRSGNMSHGIAISQLTTDTVSDILLVITPILVLRGMKITRGQRWMLMLTFASSICITIVSIAHAITLFMPTSPVSSLVVYIKAAVATFICNLLVIVTFIYRLCNKTDMDVDETRSETEPIQFTSVINGGHLTLGSSSHATSLQKSSMVTSSLG